METPTEAKKSKFKTWAFAIFIWAFLCVWLSAMTAGLTAGACRKDRYEGAKKLRFCNISLTASAWMKFSSLEQARGSRIRLERGIALSQLGETAGAVAEKAHYVRMADFHPAKMLRDGRMAGLVALHHGDRPGLNGRSGP